MGANSWPALELTGAAGRPIVMDTMTRAILGFLVFVVGCSGTAGPPSLLPNVDAAFPDDGPLADQVAGGHDGAGGREDGRIKQGPDDGQTADGPSDLGSEDRIVMEALPDDGSDVKEQA